MEETYPVINKATGATVNIKCFVDDTIETIQFRIGDATNIHPDRMRIYVKVELDRDYYAKDSRKWENLYLRMSPDGKILTSKCLSAYNSAREPQQVFPQIEFDKMAWMALDPSAETSFTELRIFGVPEERSWIFPLTNVSPEYLPIPSKATLDVKGILKTIHSQKIIGFEVIPYTEGMSPQVELVYFPRLRSGTPVLPQKDVIQSIQRQTNLLHALFELSIPPPDTSAIVQARWKLPLVNTDFGGAIRNRFEQIFYGTTLSKDIPVITFFGGRQEQSRHKFYTETPNKTPILDVRTWNYWWTATKPSKHRPSLLLYRGTSRNVYDRITINEIEITLSSSRSNESRESLEDLRKSLNNFLMSIDGISTYLDPADVEDNRWNLQDVSAVLHYSKELREADFRRFDCLRNIYELTDADKLTFKFLRSDQTDTGLTDEEIRVIQLLKENEYTTAEDIHEQLPYKSLSECEVLLTATRQKLEDNSDLIDRQYTNIPTFRMTAKQVAVTHAPDIQRIVTYINILRDILLNPDNPGLDAVCPKRVESIPSEIAVIPISTREQEKAESEEDDYLDDLLGEISDIAPAPAPAPAPTAVYEKKTRKVKAKGATSLASYFMDQLHEFDPLTFDPEDPQVLRKCDRPRQPIVMKTEELERFTDDLSQYTPTEESLDVKNPDGIVLCPEYWCTIDRIPLKKDQLVEGKCPVCGGKIRSNDKAIEKTQSTSEYPVLERDPSFVYPGYVKYRSKKNDRPIPCCFTTPQKTRVTLKAPEISTPSTEMFYILGENKTGLDELRVAYVQTIVIKALGLSIDYKGIIDSSNRLQTGQGDFFRAGVGHARNTLPRILDITTEVKSPIHNPDVIVRCSFFRTWKGADVDHDISGYSPELSRRIASIDKAFQEKQMTVLEELEYVSLLLNSMCYTLYVQPDSVQSGCFMTFSAVKNMKRAFLILIDSSGSPDYFVHVSKTSMTPTIRGNLYNNLFSIDILKYLEQLRIASCVSDVPTIEKALKLFVNTSLKPRVPEIKVVLDPYRRAQAFFLPNTILLPFRPTSNVPTFLESKITYADIPQSEYPLKTMMIEFLNIAKDIHAGFEYSHDVGNIIGNVTEIVTKSGLRIPVKTADITEQFEEIAQTVIEKNENTLAFGKADAESVKLARSITYEAEVFDFLIFQLSRDMVEDDYPTLKTNLAKEHPSIDELREPLREWMNTTIRFTEADNPPAFYSKIRHACSGSPRDKCTGLCVWDGASCRVQVKKVRSGLQKETLEKRLLSTLSSNDKIRSVIFENRMSPFFSSVLYLELPDEVILSDQDVYVLIK
jgi:hypothetical protein